MFHRNAQLAGVGCMALLLLLGATSRARAQEGDDLTAPAPEGSVPPPPAPDESVPPPPAPDESVPVPPTSPASTPLATPMADLDDVELLGAWLRAIGGQERFGRYFGGGGLVVAGGALAAFGAYFAIDYDVFGPDDLTPVVIGTLGILVGGMALVQGIGLFIRPTPNEGLARAFDEDVANGLDIRELGEYEGILRLNAEAEAYASFLSLFLGSGMILGGAACALVIALSDTSHEAARVYGYTLGATMAALGGLTIGLSRIEGPYEGAYRSYLGREGPDGSTNATAFAAPFAVEGGGGVAVVGSF